MELWILELRLLLVYLSSSSVAACPVGNCHNSNCNLSHHSHC
jgi:hypothetical protein